MNILTGINPIAVAALREACFEGEKLQVMPSTFYRQFSQTDLSAFCVEMGLYCLPTTELLEVLSQLILEASPSRNAIELGAGNGAIGRGLGIVATDNKMQSWPEIATYYNAMGQKPVIYGEDVVTLDANKAVEQYRPEVAVAAWLTHRYDERRHELGGNAFGVDEGAILAQVRRYIVVGNKHVHANKPIMPAVSRIIQGDYLFSRSFASAADNAIFVWDGAAVPAALEGGAQ